MICPQCKTRLKVRKTESLSQGSRFKCPKCSAVFVAKKPAAETTTDDFVLQINKNGTVLEFKGQSKNNLFTATDEILGKNIHDVITLDVAQPIMRCIEKALQTGELQRFECQSLLSDQHYEFKFITHGEDKVLTIITNISDYKNASEKANYLAYYDTLTNLPNRYLFNDRLQQAITHVEREKKLLALLFLDLDNFKQINDSIGHKAGDQLLRGVADRLMKSVRATDSVTHLSKADSEFMVARLGGDEFTVLLDKIGNIEEPAMVAGRILEMLAEPFIIGAHELFITASMGIAVYPYDGKDLETLLINADVAMYQAKKLGRNSYQYYSESMNKFTFERFTVENKLRKALDHNEFMLFYQPQINIQNGNIIGVEALIRWLQPDLVLTRPGEFIPLAEQTGLIIPMGAWILRVACEQNRAWQKAGLTPMLMTVNVSSIQFSQNNFVETVSQSLSDTGLDPHYLQLELTESTIMQNSQNTINKLQALQRMGVQTSIDDFGTGYSSLKYLKHFPLDTLKIDTSFVRDLITSTTDQSIVNAIITLAHNFNLKVIAEGVELREQLDYLRECGCEAVQGYFICPPVNSIALAQFAKKKKYF
ncbi:MAG: diguanylate cyclase/phosphodiesterase with and sensor(s) [Nitrospirae bacterium]|nr:diguanylate cyclase/phosphodiesterase with and sensor(s) [Nitrospirota bacterium]